MSVAKPQQNSGIVQQNSSSQSHSGSALKQHSSKSTTSTPSSHHHTHHRPSTSFFSPEKGRRVLVIRHGERIDFTFNSGGENWVSKSFDSHGKYKRFNINMPKVVPNRKDGYLNYALDTPLTEMGYLQAKITGRALKDAGVKPSHIYVSPALRCVQTCVGILKGMNNTSLQFQVEPGLFEWGAWFRPTLPSWLSPEELLNQGYPINPSYKPVYPTFDASEKLDAYYQRSFLTVKKIVEKHPEDCTILFVAHGASLDTCTRQFCGGEPRNQHDFYALLHQTPYLACAAAREVDGTGKRWEISEPPILPFQHQGNASYNWSVLNAELDSSGHH